MKGWISAMRMLAAATIGLLLLSAAKPLSAQPQLLPGATGAVRDPEVAGRQIGWFRNSTVAAHKAALAEDKPLVIVFGEADAAWYTLFQREVAPCPQFNRFAGLAIFASCYSIPRPQPLPKRSR